jgi:hypothetical protein
MVWVRRATPGLGNSLAVTLEAILILTFGTLAWRAARAHDVALHRTWALRAFIVANGVYFVRVGAKAWHMITQLSLPDDLFFIFDFASYLIPLAVLQLYLQARKSGAPPARFAMAGCLLLSSVYLSVGTFGFYLSVAKKLSS